MTIADKDRPIPVSTRITLPNAPSRAVSPVTGSELTLLNRTVFERTASYLAPEAVTAYQEAISKLGETLLQDLGEVGASRHTNEELAEEAHAIGGSASLLGFERLPAMSRQFEWGVHLGPGEAPDLIEGLSAALEVTLREIRER